VAYAEDCVEKLSLNAFGFLLNFALNLICL